MLDLIKNDNFVLRILIYLLFSIGFWGLYINTQTFHWISLLNYAVSLILILSWGIHLKTIETKIRIGSSGILLSSIALLIYIYQNQFDFKPIYAFAAILSSLYFFSRLENKNRKSVDQIFLASILLSTPILFYQELIFIVILPFVFLLLYKIKDLRTWATPIIAYLFIFIYFLSYHFLFDVPLNIQFKFDALNFEFNSKWTFILLLNASFSLYYLLQMSSYGVKERLLAQVHLVSSILLSLLCFSLKYFDGLLLLNLNYFIIPLTRIKKNKLWNIYFFLILISYLSLMFYNVVL